MTQRSSSSQLAGLVIAIVAVNAVGGLGGCAFALRQPSAADSVIARTTLTGVVDDYWRHVLATRPEVALQVAHPVTRLPSMSQDAAKQDAQYGRAVMLALDEIDVDALAEDDYVTWAMLRWEVEHLTAWPAFYWTDRSALSPGQSALERSVAAIRSLVADSLALRDRYLPLLNGLPALSRQLRAEATERAARGVSPSRVALQRAIALVRRHIAPPEASPFYVVDSLPADSLPSWRSILADSARDAIVSRINPALDTLATELESALRMATGDNGLGSLPGGREHYAALLRFHSTIDVEPEAAHAIGLREVARLAARADSARRRAGLPAARDSLRKALGAEPQWLAADRATIPDFMAGMFAAISTELDSLFPPTPASRLVIGLMSDQDADGALALYEPPTVMQEARYLINADRMMRQPPAIVAALVAGDLMPGTHRQQAIQRENEELPALRRLRGHEGFVAGWQLYALAQADSLRTSSTPLERFLMRLRELGAACGLVVDSGINALGWPRASALEFLRGCLPSDDDELERRFIIPAFEWPGRGAAAALGARELHALRRWVARELGERFDLAAFHREVLRTGSVPLPVLGSHLEYWIWERSGVPVTPP